jgi:transcriptional regulator NrdR family protein
VKCPNCNSRSTVMDTRQLKSHVRRRHICDSCSIRFTTHEKVVDTGELAGGRRTPEHMAEMRKQANRWGNKTIKTLLKRGSP